MRRKNSSRRAATARSFSPRLEILEGRVVPSTYYVSPTGSDSNLGTDPTQPWQTINKVNGTAFQPGDSILFQGGQTFSGGLVLTPTNVNGTPLLPITFGSYGTGNAIISSGNVSGIMAQSGAQGIVVQDLNFVGGGNQAAGPAGLDFMGSKTTLLRSEFLRINNVNVSQYGSAGIEITTGNYDRNGNPSGQGGWDNVQVTYTNTFDNRDSGLAFIGYVTGGTAYSHTNVYVGHVTSYGNTGYSGSPESSGDGIVLGDVYNATVERCTAYDDGMKCQTQGGGPLGIWTYDSNTVTIQYCESHHNGSQGLYDGGGFDLDFASENCTIQYCYSHDNQGVGYEMGNSYGSSRAWSNNTLRYNVSQNDAFKGAQRGGEGSITLWNDNLNPASLMYNGYIYGNAIYNSKYTLFVDNTPMEAMDVYNNIFYAANNQLTLNIGQKSYTALHFNQNDYFSASGQGIAVQWGKFFFTDLPSWRKKSGEEMLNGQTTGWGVDPQLESPGGGKSVNNADNLETKLNAYKLLSTSPLFSQGLNLQGLMGINPGSTDYYEDSLPVNVNLDIGAYQHTSAPNVILGGSLAQPVTGKGSGATEGSVLATALVDVSKADHENATSGIRIFPTGDENLAGVALVSRSSHDKGSDVLDTPF